MKNPEYYPKELPFKNTKRQKDKKKRKREKSIEKKGITKKEKKSEPLIVFLIRFEGKYVISKRPDSGLLASLYEFPNVKGTSLSEAQRKLLSKGIDIKQTKFVGKAVHVFTHKKWDMAYYLAQATAVNLDSVLLASREELSSKYAIPSAFSFGLKSIS